MIEGMPSEEEMRKVRGESPEGLFSRLFGGKRHMQEPQERLSHENQDGLGEISEEELKELREREKKEAEEEY